MFSVPRALTLLKLISMLSGSVNGCKRSGRTWLFDRFYALSKVRVFFIFGVGWCVMPMVMTWVCLLCCYGYMVGPQTNMFLRDAEFQHNTWLLMQTASGALVPKGCVSSVLQPQLSMWSALPSGVLKINVGEAITEDLPYFGVDVVARDNIGVVLSAMAWRLPGKFSHLAEIYAVRAGVLTALRFQWSSWILESDATDAVKAIYQVSPLALEASLINFIRIFCLQRPGILVVAPEMPTK